jgi:hypothetical protein
MARGTATYSGEELEAQFSASGQLTDYGVPGSPVWSEWVDPQIEGLTILNVKVDPKTLPPELVDAILALAEEVTFEAEEPEAPERDEDD